MSPLHYNTCNLFYPKQLTYIQYCGQSPQEQFGVKCLTQGHSWLQWDLNLLHPDSKSSTLPTEPQPPFNTSKLHTQKNICKHHHNVHQFCCREQSKVSNLHTVVQRLIWNLCIVNTNLLNTSTKCWLLHKSSCSCPHWNTINVLMHNWRWRGLNNSIILKWKWFVAEPVRWAGMWW